LALALALASAVCVGVLFSTAASCLLAYVGDTSEPCRPDTIDTVATFCRHGIVAHAETLAFVSRHKADVLPTLCRVADIMSGRRHVLTCRRRFGEMAGSGWQLLLDFSP
jgi:hypothetical protein